MNAQRAACLPRPQQTSLEPGDRVKSHQWQQGCATLPKSSSGNASFSADQLTEAKQMSRASGVSVGDALVRLGYATSEEVMKAIAQEHGLDYINLSEVVIPPAVVELVPESVARENVILPMAREDDSLKVIVSDPNDLDTLDKLRFILNCKVDIAPAPREHIVDAINRHYGQTEGESRRLDAAGVYRHGHRLYRDGGKR